MSEIDTLFKTATDCGAANSKLGTFGLNHFRRLSDLVRFGLEAVVAGLLCQLQSLIEKLTLVPGTVPVPEMMANEPLLALGVIGGSN